MWAKRITAVITLVAFSFTSVSYAQSVSFSDSAVEIGEPVPVSVDISVPEELGSIQERHQNPNSKKFVIVLQDAHAILDAQNHIQELIRYFQDTYGFDLIAFEGGAGPLDPTLFRAFPDEALKKKVLGEYLGRAELTGAEMAAVFNPKRAEYVGIEDWNLYEENYLAYLKAMQVKGEVLGKLAETKNRLDLRRREIYPPALNELHEQTEAFRAERIPLVEFLKFISTIHTDYEPYPNLKSLIVSIKQDELLDHEHLDVMLRRMAEDFSGPFSKLNKQEVMAFNEKRQAFVTGRLEAGAFLEHLVKTGRSMGFNPKLTPLLEMLLKSQQTLSAVKGTKLFDELERLIRELETKFAASSAQKELIEQYRRLKLTQDLVSLELTRDQWEEYDRDGSSEIVKTVPNLQPALEFYRLALSRDSAFHKNLTRLLEHKKRNSAVVLAGGFHSEGVKRFLKNSGFSYAVVAPRINSLEGHEQYQNVMQGQLSYKDYLETSFYDAFTKHASLKLAGELNEIALRRNLKLWRDELIRTLAREGRITEAASYTRYIDFRPQLRGEADQRLWAHFQSQLHEFTAGLQTLIEKKELNIPNIQLLLDRAGQTKPFALVQLAGPAMTPGLAPRSEIRAFFKTGAFPSEAVRSEVRDAEDYRDEIRKRIRQPIAIHSIAQEEALPYIEGLKAQIDSLPYVSGHFDQDHFKKLRAMSHYGSISEAIDLDSKTKLKIVSIPLNHEFETKHSGFNIFVVNDVIAGYGIFTRFLDNKQVRIRTGIHILKPFRKGARLKFASRQIYEASLRLLYAEFQPTEFEVDIKGRILVSISDPFENAGFWLKRGFFPKDARELSDQYLDSMIHTGTLVNERMLDTLLASSRESVWIFPMRRSEARDTSDEDNDRLKALLELVLEKKMEAQTPRQRRTIQLLYTVARRIVEYKTEYPERNEETEPVLDAYLQLAQEMLSRNIPENIDYMINSSPRTKGLRAFMRAVEEGIDQPVYQAGFLKDTLARIRTLHIYFFNVTRGRSLVIESSVKLSESEHGNVAEAIRLIEKSKWLRKHRDTLAFLPLLDWDAVSFASHAPDVLAARLIYINELAKTKKREDNISLFFSNENLDRLHFGNPWHSFSRMPPYAILSYLHAFGVRAQFLIHLWKTQKGRYAYPADVKGQLHNAKRVLRIFRHSRFDSYFDRNKDARAWLDESRELWRQIETDFNSLSRAEVRDVSDEDEESIFGGTTELKSAEEGGAIIGREPAAQLTPEELEARTAEFDRILASGETLEALAAKAFAIFSRGHAYINQLSRREDAMQEAVSRLLARRAAVRDRYDPASGSPDSFVTNYLVWRIADFFRALRSGKERQMPLNTEGDEVASVLADSREPSPSDSAIAQESGTLSRILRNQLPELLRKAIGLREQGLSYEDIAKQTGIPLGTVKSRLAKARKTLGDWLQLDNVFESALARAIVKLRREGKLESFEERVLKWVIQGATLSEMAERFNTPAEELQAGALRSITEKVRAEDPEHLKTLRTIWERNQKARAEARSGYQQAVHVIEEVTKAAASAFDLAASNPERALLVFTVGVPALALIHYLWREGSATWVVEKLERWERAIEKRPWATHSWKLKRILRLGEKYHYRFSAPWAVSSPEHRVHAAAWKAFEAFLTSIEHSNYLGQRDKIDLLLRVKSNHPFWGRTLSSLEELSSAGALLSDNREYAEDAYRHLLDRERKVARSEVRISQDVLRALEQYDLGEIRSISPMPQEQSGLAQPYFIEAAGKKWVISRTGWRKRPSTIEWESSFREELRKAGLKAVPRIKRAENGKPFSKVGDVYYIVGEFREGSRVEWGQIRGKGLLNAAKTLAKFHNVSANVSLKGRNLTASEHNYALANLSNQEQMVRFFNKARDSIDSDPVKKRNKAYQYYLRILDLIFSQIQILQQKAKSGVYAPLPKTIIHGDFNSRNLLFTGSEVTGFLDFDYSRETFRIQDLANGVISIDWTEDKPVDFTTLIEFIKAYQAEAKMKLTEDEMKALPDAFRAWFLEGMAVGVLILDKEHLSDTQKIKWFKDIEKKIRSLDRSLERGDWKELHKAISVTRSEARQHERWIRLGIPEESIMAPREPGESIGIHPPEVVILEEASRDIQILLKDALGENWEKATGLNPVIFLFFKDFNPFVIAVLKRDGGLARIPLTSLEIPYDEKDWERANLALKKNAHRLADFRPTWKAAFNATNPESVQLSPLFVTSAYLDPAEWILHMRYIPRLTMGAADTGKEVQFQIGFDHHLYEKSSSKGAGRVWFGSRLLRQGRKFTEIMPVSLMGSEKENQDTPPDLQYVFSDFYPQVEETLRSKNVKNLPKAPGTKIPQSWLFWRVTARFIEDEILIDYETPLGKSAAYWIRYGGGGIRISEKYFKEQIVKGRKQWHELDNADEKALALSLARLSLAVAQNQTNRGFIMSLPSRSAFFIEAKRWVRSEARESFKGMDDLVQYIAGHWEQIKTRGAFAFDMQGTLVERKHGLTDGMKELLAWLINNDVRIIITSGNPPEDILTQVIEPLKPLLDSPSRLRRATIYANIGTLRMTFDRHGNPVVDRKYQKAYVLPPKLLEELKGGLRELAKRFFFMKADREKTLAQRADELRAFYEKDGKADYDLPWLRGGGYEPSVVEKVEKTGDKVSGPFIEKRGLTSRRKPTALAVRMLLDPYRAQVVTFLRNWIEQKLGSGYLVSAGGKSTIDVRKEFAGYYLRLFGMEITWPFVVWAAQWVRRDWLRQYVGNKGGALEHAADSEALDPRFIFYFGDELFRGKETGAEGNDLIVYYHHYLNPAFQNMNVVALNLNEPEGLTAEERARTFHITGEHMGTEKVLSAFKEKISAGRSEARAEEAVAISENEHLIPWTIRFLDRFLALVNRKEQGEPAIEYEDLTGENRFDLLVPDHERAFFNGKLILRTDFQGFNIYESDVPVFAHGPVEHSHGVPNLTSIHAVSIALDPQANQLIKLEVLRKRKDQPEEPMDPTRLLFDADGKILNPEGLILRASIAAGEDFHGSRSEIRDWFWRRVRALFGRPPLKSADREWENVAWERFEEKFKNPEAHYRAWSKAVKSLFESKSQAIQGYQLTVVDRTKALADLMDEFLKFIYRTAEKQKLEGVEKIALIAVGSHGRRETVPVFSDADVRIIVPGRDDMTSPVVEFLGRAVVDILRKGPLPRIAEDPVEIESVTSGDPQEVAQMTTEMLDARFIVGNKDIDGIRERTFKRNLDEKSDRFISILINAWDKWYQEKERLEGLFKLEPNLKDLLRHMHFASWIAKTYLKTQEDPFQWLIAAGLLSAEELRHGREAHEFLLEVRYHIALSNEPGSPDELSFERQRSVALLMGYLDEPDGGMRAEEKLMKDVYRNSRRLFGFSIRIIRRIADKSQETAQIDVPGKVNHELGVKITKRIGWVFSVDSGFQFTIDRPRTMLVPLDVNQKMDPAKILPIIQYGASEGAHASGELLDQAEAAILLFYSRFRGQSESDLQFQKEARNQFWELFGPYNLERQLWGLELLGVSGLVIPEFGALAGRTSSDFTRRYTLDVHSLTEATTGLERLLFPDPEETKAFWSRRTRDLATDAVRAVLDNEALRRALSFTFLTHTLYDSTPPGQREEVINAVLARFDKITPEERELVLWLHARNHKIIEMMRRNGFRRFDVFRKFIDEEIGRDNYEKWLALLVVTLIPLRLLRPEYYEFYQRKLAPLFEITARTLRDETELRAWLENERERRKTYVMDQLEGLPGEDRDRPIAVNIRLLNEETGAAEVLIKIPKDQPGVLSRLTGILGLHDFNLKLLDVLSVPEGAFIQFTGTHPGFVRHRTIKITGPMSDESWEREKQQRLKDFERSLDEERRLGGRRVAYMFDVEFERWKEEQLARHKDHLDHYADRPLEQRNVEVTNERWARQSWAVITGLKEELLRDISELFQGEGFNPDKSVRDLFVERGKLYESIKPTAPVFKDQIPTQITSTEGPGLTWEEVRTIDRDRLLLHFITRFFEELDVNLGESGSIDTRGDSERRGFQAVDTFDATYRGGPLSQPMKDSIDRALTYMFAQPVINEEVFQETLKRVDPEFRASRSEARTGDVPEDAAAWMREKFGPRFNAAAVLKFSGDFRSLTDGDGLHAVEYLGHSGWRWTYRADKRIIWLAEPDLVLGTTPVGDDEEDMGDPGLHSVDPGWHQTHPDLETSREKLVQSQLFNEIVSGLNASGKETIVRAGFVRLHDGYRPYIMTEFRSEARASAPSAEQVKEHIRMLEVMLSKVNEELGNEALGKPSSTNLPSFLASSDHHGHVAALKHTLAAAEKRKADKIYLVGDLYSGPQGWQYYQMLRSYMEHRRSSQPEVVPFFGNHENTLVLGMLGNRLVLDEFFHGASGKELLQDLNKYLERQGKKPISFLQPRDEFLEEVISNPELIEMADWIRKTHALLRVDVYGSAYVHGFPALSSKGDILFKQFINQTLQDQMDELERDLKGPPDAALRAAGRLNSRGFSPLWSSAKMQNRAQFAAAFYPEGIRRVIHGNMHGPGPVNVADANQQINIAVDFEDQKGAGGYLIAGSEGLHFYKFRDLETGETGEPENLVVPAEGETPRRTHLKNTAEHLFGRIAAAEKQYLGVLDPAGGLAGAEYEWLESVRTTGAPWVYRLYVELHGHVSDSETAERHLFQAVEAKDPEAFMSLIHLLYEKSVDLAKLEEEINKLRPRLPADDPAVQDEFEKLSKRFRDAKTMALELLLALQEMTRREKALFDLRLRGQFAKTNLAQIYAKLAELTDRDLAGQAIENISFIPPTPASDAVLRNALYHDIRSVRGGAAKALIRMGDRAYRIVAWALKSDDTWARFLAFWVIGHLGLRSEPVRPKAIEDIKKALRTETDWLIYTAGSEILRRLGGHDPLELPDRTDFPDLTKDVLAKLGEIVASQQEPYRKGLKIFRISARRADFAYGGLFIGAGLNDLAVELKGRDYFPPHFRYFKSHSRKGRQHPWEGWRNVWISGKRTDYLDGPTIVDYRDAGDLPPLGDGQITLYANLPDEKVNLPKPEKLLTPAGIETAQESDRARYYLRRFWRREFSEEQKALFGRLHAAAATSMLFELPAQIFVNEAELDVLRQIAGKFYPSTNSQKMPFVTLREPREGKPLTAVLAWADGAAFPVEVHMRSEARFKKTVIPEINEGTQVSSIAFQSRAEARGNISYYAGLERPIEGDALRAYEDKVRQLFDGKKAELMASGERPGQRILAEVSPDVFQMIPLEDYLQAVRFYGFSDFEKWAKSLEGKRVLDSGAGSGYLVRALNQRGIPAEGIDADSKAVEKARSSSLNVRLGDVRYLPYADASFDAVYSRRLLAGRDARTKGPVSNPDDVQDALKESFRVLKPGGRLYLENNFSDEEIRGLAAQTGFQAVSDPLVRNNQLIVFEKLARAEIHSMREGLKFVKSIELYSKLDKVERKRVSEEVKSWQAPVFQKDLQYLDILTGDALIAYGKDKKVLAAVTWADIRLGVVQEVALAVHPDFKRHGIAFLLQSAFIRELQRQYYRILSIDVAQNENALAFHTAFVKTLPEDLVEIHPKEGPLNQLTIYLDKLSQARTRRDARIENKINNADLKGLNLRQAAEKIGETSSALSSYFKAHPDHLLMSGIVRWKRKDSDEKQAAKALRKPKRKNIGMLLDEYKTLHGPQSLKGLSLNRVAKLIGRTRQAVSLYFKDREDELTAHGLVKQEHFGRSEARGMPTMDNLIEMTGASYQVDTSAFDSRSFLLKEGQAFVINDTVKIKAESIHLNDIRMAFDAPEDFYIDTGRPRVPKGSHAPERIGHFSSNHHAGDVIKIGENIVIELEDVLDIHKETRAHESRDLYKLQIRISVRAEARTKYASVDYILAISEELSPNSFSPGDLKNRGFTFSYDRLNSLEREGYIERTARSGYRITEKGRAAIEKRKTELPEWQFPFLMGMYRWQSRARLVPSIGERIKIAEARFHLAPQNQKTIKTLSEMTGVKPWALKAYLRREDHERVQKLGIIDAPASTKKRPRPGKQRVAPAPPGVNEGLSRYLPRLNAVVHDIVIENEGPHVTLIDLNETLSSARRLTSQQFGELVQIYNQSNYQYRLYKVTTEIPDSYRIDARSEARTTTPTLWPEIRAEEILNLVKTGGVELVELELIKRAGNKLFEITGGFSQTAFADIPASSVFIPDGVRALLERPDAADVIDRAHAKLYGEPLMDPAQRISAMTGSLVYDPTLLSMLDQTGFARAQRYFTARTKAGHRIVLAVQKGFGDKIARDLTASAKFRYDPNDPMTDAKLKRVLGSVGSETIIIVPMDAPVELNARSELRQRGVRVDPSLNIEPSIMSRVVEVVLGSKLRKQLKDENSASFPFIPSELFQSVIDLLAQLLEVQDEARETILSAA